MTPLKRFFKPSQSPALKKIQTRINYRFKDLDLLRQAFVHRSIAPQPRTNYERLEFLGDAVIDIVVSHESMREFPEGDEGLLTQKRSGLVQKSFLASMGQIFDLLDYLKIESTVDLKQDKIATRQLANLFEALVGAVFLDGGLEPARRLILDTIWKNRRIAWETVNYKGHLIELCHTLNIGNPKFKVTAVSGPEHQKLFEVHVKIRNQVYPSGIGSNKKTAEQSAAQQALESLQS